MEGDGSKCYNCKYFDGYYTKGTVRYDKTKLGWCFKNHCIVKTQETCEHYVYRPRTRKSSRALKMHLSDILTELSEIRKVLEEEHDDDENV